MVEKLQINRKLGKKVKNYQPSLMVRVSYFILLTSCASIRFPWIERREDELIQNYNPMSTLDYVDHLNFLKKSFLVTPGVDVLFQNDPLKRQRVESFVENLCQEMISKNETFFKNLKKVKVTFLKQNAPLYFSLPNGEIFLSAGLIQKYVKHESVLMSLLAYELVRSEKYLYPKMIFFPSGFFDYQKMIMLSRLDLSEKMLIHQWAHHLIQRVGHDGEYYLTWLQTQNRNTADFALQVGDVNLINREESLFKAFLIKLSSTLSGRSLSEGREMTFRKKKNSSKKFYLFLSEIRDGI